MTTLREVSRLVRIHLLLLPRFCCGRTPGLLRYRASQWAFSAPSLCFSRRYLQFLLQFGLRWDSDNGVRYCIGKILAVNCAILGLHSLHKAVLIWYYKIVFMDGIFNLCLQSIPPSIKVFYHRGISNRGPYYGYSYVIRWVLKTWDCHANTDKERIFPAHTWDVKRNILPKKSILFNIIPSSPQLDSVAFH